jgi:hypothetical protein
MFKKGDRVRIIKKFKDTILPHRSKDNITNCANAIDSGTILVVSAVSKSGFVTFRYEDNRSAIKHVGACWIKFRPEWLEKVRPTILIC